MYQVVFKMALLLFKKCKFPQFSAKCQQKLKFLEKILKIHAIKVEMCLNI